MARGRSAAVFLLGCLLSLVVAAQARRPMTFNDLMQMRRLGDIAVSPDGNWVMYSAVDVDLGKNTKTSHLWVIPVTGGTARALTDTLAGETRGRFSPDGKQILFESSREGGQQIWLADFDPTTGASGAATSCQTSPRRRLISGAWVGYQTPPRSGRSAGPFGIVIAV